MQISVFQMRQIDFYLWHYFFAGFESFLNVDDSISIIEVDDMIG